MGEFLFEYGMFLAKAITVVASIGVIVMLIAGEENLREVTMFPMNQKAEDLMMGAPSDVTLKQLRELMRDDKETGYDRRD